MKIHLAGKTPEELKHIALQEGLPGFAGKQIAQWLYGKRAGTLDQMTNLSKAAREKLGEKYDTGITAPVDVQTSIDGTRKYLFSVNRSFVASAPQDDKAGFTLIPPPSGSRAANR